MSELSTLPTYEMNNFSRWVVKETLAYFENPDVQVRFEKWKRERDAQTNSQEGGNEVWKNHITENYGGCPMLFQYLH